MESPSQNSRWIKLLEELQAAHTDLLAAIIEMEKVTRLPTAEMASFTRARWQISRASLVRRALWGTIYNALSGVLAERDRKNLGRLDIDDRTLLRASAAHISQWTTAAAVERWEEYCAASQQIRWRMKAGIGAERRIVYPLLAMTADRQSSSRQPAVVGRAAR